MSESLDEALRRTADIYLEDAPFVEVRILGDGRTLSGFFVDAASAAAALAAFDGKRSAYIMANRINPSFGHGSLGKFGLRPRAGASGTPTLAAASGSCSTSIQRARKRHPQRMTRWRRRSRSSITWLRTCAALGGRSQWSPSAATDGG